MILKRHQLVMLQTVASLTSVMTLAKAKNIIGTFAKAKARANKTLRRQLRSSNLFLVKVTSVLSHSQLLILQMNF